MANEIDILVVEPGKAPYPAKAENTLEAFRQIVGGPVEAGCYLSQRVLLVCNSEGKSMGLTPNRENPTDSIYGAPPKPSEAGSAGSGGAKERRAVFRFSRKRSRVDFAPTLSRGPSCCAASRGSTLPLCPPPSSGSLKPTLPCPV